MNYLASHYDGDVSDLLENLDPFIDALPDPEAFLRDPNNWISCTVASTLYARARELLKDEMAPYKMAVYAAENASLGYAQRIIVKSLWSVKTVLKNAQKLNDKWNRNKRVELVSTRRNDAVVRLHWNSEMNSSRDICLYNQGAYASMPIIWGGELLTLQEKACYFKGDPYCEYHLQWPTKNRFYEIASRIFKKKSVLMETISEMERDKQIIEQKYEEVNQLNIKLNRRIKQLIAVQETGKAILSVLDLNELLSLIMSHLSDVCRIHRAVIMLVDKEAGYLKYIHGVGFKGKVPEDIIHYRVPLHRKTNIISRVADTGVPEYIPEVERSDLRKENVMLSYAQPSSLFVVPLITKSEVIGVIATDAADEGGVPKETRETLEIFSHQIAIAIQNAKLYNQLQEQMEELKRSQALLKRTEKLSFLGNLAARLAHEIKNPMTAIGTFMQMLPTKYKDEEFRKDFYSIAMEETARINNLISELLDLVKTRESLFESADLHSLIQKMVLLISPQSNAKKIKVKCTFDDRIEAVRMDAGKMKEIILNVLSNATEFTPPGGKIEIATRLDEESDDQSLIHIEISDNGPGIKPDIMDKIFDPYYTTKHKSDMHNGTGLGLFIAQQNMQDHGGDIEVISPQGRGTTFKLTLPFSEDASSTPEHPEILIES